MAAGGRPAIEVEGAREVRAGLRRLGDRAGDLKDVHRESAEIVATAARPLIPVMTGGLLGSLRISATKSGAGVLAGGRRVPYGAVIHFGWPARGIEPQPYLYDALDERRDEVADRYADAIGRLVLRFEAETPG
jgi:hypothetical protein